MVIDPNELNSFWPMEYAYNEETSSGPWLFSGTRNVPESGGTLLYLAIGMIVLGSAGIKRLAWRNQ